MTIQNIDLNLIHFFRKFGMPVARWSIFVIFFWFGLLKVAGLSPASGLVADLLNKTLPFITPQTFILCFGLFEMIIGFLFVIKGMERVVIPLLFLHMVTTFMTLIMVPAETWSAFMVPTLEGQYVIKNFAIIAVAMGIASHLHPIKQKNA